MNSTPKEPSEKIRLRDKARYLRKRISQAKALLQKRKDVQDLKGQLEALQEQIDHPQRFNY